MWARRDRALGAAVLALGAAQAAVWTAGLPEGAGTTGFAWRAVALFALQVGAVGLLWKRRGAGWTVVVLGFALVFRIAAWSWPPDLSSDLHRYVWDGQVQLAGHSPYAAAPADPRLAHLRDASEWPRINRPEAITVYPPGGQLAFLALAAVGGDSARDVKTAAVLCELVALGLLALMLGRRTDGPSTRARRWPRAGPLALYAWSPLVIAETAVSGHVDALVLPLLLGALWLALEGRARLAGLLIGMGALVKIYPLLLLAALPKEQRARAAMSAGAVALAAYLPYTAISGRGVLGFLPEYARSGEDFNPAVRGLLEGALAWAPHAREVAMALCAAGLGATVAVLARRGGDDHPGAREPSLGGPPGRAAGKRRPPHVRLVPLARGSRARDHLGAREPSLGGPPGRAAGKRRPPHVRLVPLARGSRARDHLGARDLLKTTRSIALAFVLLLPTAVHPWYAVWLVPLVALRPHPAGVWIAGLVPLSYLKYGAPGEVMPAWVPLVLWVPALALLALPALRKRLLQRRRLQRKRPPQPEAA